MSSEGGRAQSLRFEGFELDLDAAELRRAGERLRLPLQPVRLLGLLAARSGHVVTREEIREYLWPADTFVDYEQGINACIRQVRGALDDHADRPRYVETLPKIGYRFLPAVEAVETVEAVVTDGRDGTPRAALMVSIGLAVAVTLVAVALIGARIASSGGPTEASAASRPVVMILPFRNLTGQAADDPLGDGLTEELIAQLGRRYGVSLAVIARTTAMKYSDTTLSIGEIARQLDADYLLEGSIRRGGDELRITAQLIRGDDESHIWAANYDRALDDPLAVQTEIGQRIAEALGLHLLRGEPTGSAATTPEAYEAYLRGSSALRRQEPGSATAARRELERAVRLDPGFASAHVALARAIRFTESGPDVWPRVRGEVEQALALDDELPEAHAMLAAIRLYADYDREGARDAWLRALRLNPVDAEAHHGIAAAWSSLGRHDEAIAAVHRALALDPRSEAVASDVGWYAYFARRYDEAIEGSRDTLTIDPGYFWAHRCIILAATLQGDTRTAADQARRHLARLAEAGLPAGETLARVEGVEDPEAVLRAYWSFDLELRDRSARQGRERPAQRAVALLALGREDEAVDALERAVTRRSGWLPPFLTVDPWFDRLRDDARFQSLLQRIDLAGQSARQASRSAGGD